MSSIDVRTPNQKQDSCLKRYLFSVLLNVDDEAIARQKETEQKQWKIKKRGKDGEEAAEGAAKSKRPFRGIDSTSQAAARGLLDTLSGTKANIDANANHAYATKNMEILGELGKTQDHILKHLESNGFDREERYRRLSAILAEVHDPFYSIEDKVSSLYDHMAKTQQRAEVTRIVDWLSPAADEGRRKTYHKSLSSPKHRLPASGRRLLDHPEYLKWEKSKTSSIRCISVVEGTGKTLLFSVTIDHLQTLITNNGDSELLAFFYTSAQGGSLLTNPDDIIRSTTRQLSTTQAGTIQPTGKESTTGFYQWAMSGRNHVDEIRNERIDPVRITAQSTLRWLLCIQEPLLPIYASNEAVSTEDGVDKPEKSNLHSACRRLVKTDHYAGALVFAHPCVRENFIKLPEYSQSDGHLSAAERCVKMMINAASSVSRLSAAQVRIY
ncbi:MAG: hypothetical protein Q9197_003279 [Variospora fuerteventurae]